MDAFDRLEQDIRRAIRQPQPHTRVTGSARRVRRSGLALAAAGVLVLGSAAIAGIPLLSTGPVTPRSPGVDARAHFAIFRRPARPDDRLPTAPHGNGERATAGDVTRLAHDRGSTKVFMIAKRDGRLCLVYRDAAIGSSTCTSTAQAARAALPLELTMNRRQGAQVFMVLPDGIDHVDTITAAGTHERVQARENLAALPRGARAVEWRDRERVRHELQNLSPTLPR